MSSEIRPSVSPSENKKCQKYSFTCARLVSVDPTVVWSLLCREPLRIHAQTLCRQKLDSMAYIFAADSTGLSSFIFFCGGLRKTHLFWNRMRIGRSRSSNVIDFGTNRKGVCDFILVISSNYGSILHRFWDTASYWLKIANFSYHTLVWRPRSGGSRQNFWMRLIAQKLERWGYCIIEENCAIQPFLNDPSVILVTDRQTNGRNCDGICLLNMLSRAKICQRFQQLQQV